MSRLTAENRRQSLLEAGRSLWAAQPFDAVRPADITAATGTSIGLVYHHFGSKRGFYVETVRDVAERLIEATEPRGEGTAERITSTLAGFVAFVDREGPLLRAVLRGGLGVDAEVGDIAQHVRDVNTQRVLDDLGLPESARLRVTVSGWIGFCETVALDHVAEPRLSSHELVVLMAESLWRLVQ